MKDYYIYVFCLEFVRFLDLKSIILFFFFIVVIGFGYEENLEREGLFLVYIRGVVYYGGGGGCYSIRSLRLLYILYL